jgi:MYXO-CTERM domain-containing protein
MSKMLATAAGLALAAGALANPHISQNLDGTSAGSFSPRGMTNTIINVDISNTESRFALSDPGNVVLNIDLAAALGLASGSQVTMTSIGWDVNLTTFGASWLSEARMYFDDNIAPDLSGLFLTPGIGNGFGGTNVNFASAGQIDFSDNAIPNIVLPNGVLRIEFFEGFVDDTLGADAIWDLGSTLFVGVQEVPAPGAAAVLGLAGLAGLRRRR